MFVKAGPSTVRLTLVEYAAPEPILQELATVLGAELGALQGQIVAAGERIATTLTLRENPLTLLGSGVRVADVAGLLRVSPRLELEIAPKFLGNEWASWREDFFFLSMLSRHGRLLANERLGSTLGTREDLATLVARAMISMFWESHRRPLRTYRHEQVEDFVIDGEVEPDSVVLPPADGYSQRLVTYDRRNLFNAAILAATRTLLPEVRDPQTRTQLVKVAEVLAPQVTLRRAQHRNVPSRARRWQSLHDLAIDVLRGFGVAYDTGSMRAFGFVLDTWRMWENLLTVALRMSWGSRNVLSQRPVALGMRTSFDAHGKASSRTAWVRPDLAVSYGLGLIVDAKYKGRVGEVKNQISEDDLYECLAFASATKKRQIVLLYPAVARDVGDPETGRTVIFERVVIGDVIVLGMEIEVRGISRRGALRSFGDTLVASLTPLVGATAAA